MTNDSSSKLGKCMIAFTPKGLWNLAQGCSRSELPWVDENNRGTTPTGLRPSLIVGQNPVGVRRRDATVSQGSSLARATLG